MDRPCPTELRLLVVDDHAAIRHAVRFRLQGSGIAVVAEAATATAGLLAALEQPLDAVLLDVHLPDGSGLTVLEQIKAARSNLPVLMHSSVAISDIVTRCRNLGASDYLIKGTDGPRLCTAIREACINRLE